MIKICFVYQISENDITYECTIFEKVTPSVLTTAGTATRFVFILEHDATAVTPNMVRCNFWLPLFANS